MRVTVVITVVPFGQSAMTTSVLGLPAPTCLGAVHSLPFPGADREGGAF